MTKLITILMTAFFVTTAFAQTSTEPISTAAGHMNKVGVFVRLEAKKGKEEAVAKFLRSALPLATAEPKTTAWYAVRLNQNTFAIFDTFPDETGRKAHLDGPIAAELMKQAPTLFSNKELHIERFEILAVK